MEDKKIRIISIVLGIIIGLILIFFGFTLIQRVFIRAGNIAPRDVVVSEITNGSATITWSTSEDSQGVVEYGTSPSSLNFFAPETEQTKSHKVELTLLSPNTTYYFQIKIGDRQFDNGGVPWTFTTKASAESQPLVSPTKSLSIPPEKKAQPTPISQVEVPAASATPVSSTGRCDETDCEKIKSKIGQGCDVSDYTRCLKSASPTPTRTPCTDSDCQAIKSKIASQECTVQEYIRCLQKNKGSTPTPTATASASTPTP